MEESPFFGCRPAEAAVKHSNYMSLLKCIKLRDPLTWEEWPAKISKKIHLLQTLTKIIECHDCNTVALILIIHTESTILIENMSTIETNQKENKGKEVSASS